MIEFACSMCGAPGHASCSCGAPLLPKLQRAAEAIAASPEKSNRAIAAELGINPATVDRARKGTAACAAVEPPTKRIGRDGKARRVPVQKISEADLDAAGKRIKAEMDEIETADTQVIEAMIAARQNPGDDRTGARRRDAIRRVGDTLAWELRNAGIRGVLRARKNPQAQAGAYQKSVGVLMRFQVLLELAKAAP